MLLYRWQKGRELSSATVNGVTSNYTYNSDGLRTRKVVGNKVYDYYWFGSQLAMMTITEGSNVITMKFYYDEIGTPIMLDYNDTLFYYVTNLQGDVVGIVCEAKEVGSYVYDAWGNPISTSSNGTAEANIIQNNPLRYRGYIYDAETGFYYLQSRYYDPVMCRFINADGYVSTGTGFIGYNMYAYCDNNPVKLLDPTGEFPEIIIALILSASINVITTFVAAKVTDQEYTWVDALVYAAAGATNVIPYVGPYVNATISGGYSGLVSYNNGATVEESVFVGVVSGVMAAVTIGNLANLGTKTVESIMVTGFADLIFGVGNNSIAAASSKAVIETDEAFEKTPWTEQAEDEEIK